MPNRKAPKPKAEASHPPAANGPAGENRLVGTWTRVQPERTSAPYPQAIEFKARGIYFTQKGDRQEFTVWDAGGYRVMGTGRIRMSTANDAEIVYRYSISGDLLTIWTEDGEFTYKRVT